MNSSVWKDKIINAMMEGYRPEFQSLEMQDQSSNVLKEKARIQKFGSVFLMFGRIRPEFQSLDV